MNALGRALVAGWVMIAAAIACSSSVVQPDSETHWLSACSLNADCGSSFQCWCGLCTSLCTSTSDCSKLPSGTVCADSNTANTACSGVATTTACVLPCGALEPSGTQPCVVLGAHASCGRDGVCETTAASSRAPSKSLRPARKPTRSSRKRTRLASRTTTASPAWMFFSVPRDAPAGRFRRPVLRKLRRRSRRLTHHCANSLRALGALPNARAAALLRASRANAFCRFRLGATRAFPSYRSRALSAWHKWPLSFPNT
jgi:hypothetical protein